MLSRVLSRVLRITFAIGRCQGAVEGAVEGAAQGAVQGAVQGAPDHVCDWAVLGCCPGCCARDKGSKAEPEFNVLISIWGLCWCNFFCLGKPKKIQIGGPIFWSAWRTQK